MNIYPTGSSPGKFHGTSNKHEPTSAGIIGSLLICTTITNVETAFY